MIRTQRCLIIWKLGRTHSYSTVWVELWVKTPSYASHPVSQPSGALLSHVNWCKATMSMCRGLIWDKVKESISYLPTWEHSLSVWLTVDSPSTIGFHLNLRSGYAKKVVKHDSLRYFIISIIPTNLLSYYYCIWLCLFYIQNHQILTL